MNQRQLALLAIAVLVWGSTWYAIKFQLGVVDPFVSVGWRFLAAALLTFLVCHLGGVNLSLSPSQHAWSVALGLSLFGLNYCLFYFATGLLTTGLIAVIFSSMVIWNAIGARIFFKTPVPIRVVIGAIVGFCGMSLLFMPDIFNLRYGPAEIGAILICVLATLCASLGNLINARNQRAGISLWAGNAWGMFYGSIATLVLAKALGAELTFDFSLPYVASFAYLTLFGSILAFAAYLSLVNSAGPERAAFATLLFPVVALAISTLFEDYRWTIEAMLGAALVLAGNRIALRTV
ncbi:MAG: DMT family transporter [Litorivicinus sp.]